MEPVAIKPISGYDEKINVYVEPKKEYYPTWLEWASKNREQVVIGVGGITSIPAGKDFYLTSAYIQGSSLVAGYGIQSIGFTGVFGGYSFIAVETYTSSPCSVSTTYPYPLKINSGSQLLYTNINQNSNYVLIGFYEELGSTF